jgi:1,4-alpha-glucan branching enzyme
MDGGGVKFGSFAQKHYVEFAFWYPDAAQVWVTLGDSDFEWHDYEMISVEPGVWETKIAKARPGMPYRYKIKLLDSDEIITKNDPFARQLSSSIDGNSVVVDEKFTWGDQDFEPVPRDQQMIYELHIGTFNQPDASTAGTFASALEKLPYLKELGVNMVELMPVTSMLDGVGWGYAPIHLFAVEEKYGGHYGLKKFVQTAHEMGIGVILDMVYNHLHPYTDLPEAYFFSGDLRDTDWGPRLDYTNPQTQNYLTENVRMWFEDYHIDGMRLDFTIGIRNRNMFADNIEDAIPGGWAILQKMTRTARSVNRRALMIAEDNGANDYLTKPISEQGAGFTAQWGVGFPRALRGAFGVREYQNLGDLTEELYRFYNGKWQQKIVFSESHDTAALANGNERLPDDFDAGDPLSLVARQKVVLSAGILLTAPGIPMLFQGQESMQFTGFSALIPFEWRLAEHFPGITLAHQHLIDLRLNKYGHTTGLTGGEINIFHTDETNHVLAYTRGDCIIIANFSEQTLTDYTLALPRDGELTVRFNSSWDGYSHDFPNILFDKIKTDEEKRATLTLPALALIIIS